MEKRPLGDSGLDISIVGLGTWAMGGDVAWWGRVDDRESIAAIHEALDGGMNWIDTAPIYGCGHAEEIVGKVIQGRRSDVIVATKCGLMFPDLPGTIPERCLTRDSIIRECEESLRRLRTDFIDLYQCHWPDPETPIRGTMEAMESLLSQGKIGAIGVSNFNCEQISGAREHGTVHALQPPFSMLQLRAADDLIPYCMEYGIGVIPYGPLSKGLLTGKFHANSVFDDHRAQEPDFIGDRFRRNLDIVESLKTIAADYDKTVAQLAVNWTATYPGVTAPIVGAKRPSQVREVLGGVGWSLSDDDRDRIDRMLREPWG